MNAIALALRAQARALELVADALETSTKSESEFYGEHDLPAGETSWRAVRERAPGNYDLVRLGRRVVVVRESYDKWLRAKALRKGPVAITSSDEKALLAMGLTLPRAATNRR